MKYIKLILVLTGLCLVIPAISAEEPPVKRNVKLTMGEEHVIVRGIRPEEKLNSTAHNPNRQLKYEIYESNDGRSHRIVGPDAYNRSINR